MFDDALRREPDGGVGCEAAIVSGFARDEFPLYFQPVVELSSGAVIGEEPLTRWHRPGHGLVAPVVFIPTAERSNLICEIHRSFIGSSAPGAREAVELMINASPAVGLLVVVEGVEHGEQLTPPIDMGCDVAQGYYLAHPQPAAAFAPTAPTAPTTSAGLSDLGR